MQGQSGTNLNRVKEYNQARVLDIVRTRGPVSRREIADASGLKFQTVSNIIARLSEVGVISEQDPAASDGGRKSVKLSVNEEAAYAVGIQLSRSELAVVATDFSGEVLARASSDVPVSDGPSRVVPALCEMVKGVLEEAELPEDRVRGAGIGMPGTPMPKTGRMLDPALAAWSDYPLKRELESRLGMPVYVDNDATAAALGERWGGAAQEAAGFVYVYLGSGVGAGIFANHQVWRGASGNSGEIGHVSVEPDGPPCYCGNRGCLEVYVSPQGILREARTAALRYSHLPPESRPPVPEKLEDVIEGSEPVYRSVVWQAADRLGQAISGVVGVLDPELIVLGGPTTEILGESFREATVRALQTSALPSRPVAEVELSTLGAEAGPVGAAALVLHDLYAPSVQRLSLV